MGIESALACVSCRLATGRAAGFWNVAMPGVLRARVRRRRFGGRRLAVVDYDRGADAALLTVLVVVDVEDRDAAAVRQVNGVALRHVRYG
jgi:hypothetical protein